ncbi:hypothetical protein [Cupriavidus sp. DF5525]|uniref:hypothetical protein n=1 Tax=Cupriavidus sp. DF5525 TaxID=3160989 RepID=UPI0032DF9BCD
MPEIDQDRVGGCDSAMRSVAPDEGALALPADAMSKRCLSCVYERRIVGVGDSKAAMSDWLIHGKRASVSPLHSEQK